MKLLVTTSILQSFSFPGAQARTDHSSKSLNVGTVELLMLSDYSGDKLMTSIGPDLCHRQSKALLKQYCELLYFVTTHLKP